MDISRDKPTGTDGTPYIWLRYTTQFTTGGRTHTIEMGIPVPVGASVEVREQLIREAEMGMEQLSRRVEGRVSQMLQRTSRPPETARTQEPSTARPAQAPQQGSTTGMPATAGTQPASPAPPQQPAAAQLRQGQSVAANMPLTPGIQGDNMKLSQFLQVIRETWELSPKEAMDLLHVKNLNSVNYREALRELQVQLGEKAGNTNASMQAKNRPVSSQPKPASSTPPVSPARPGGEVARGTQATTGGERAGLREVKGPAQSAAATPAPAKPPAAPTPPVRPAPGALAGPAHIPVIPIRDEMVREAPKVFKFDEEDEEIEEEKGMKSEEQTAIARIKLDELKEVRGASVASPGRLMVLQNVLNSQISDEQLQRIIQSTWGATSVKKLKVDQVEALISWAKEDFFLDEVEAVLDLIDEEESYARSDR
ncbi:MAG TPA: hypothetical protein VKB35_19250 [Ktedonobacteraceae bacterium]|nr:hypothetical protein [Ktedonobacteraceae bacterium]